MDNKDRDRVRFSLSGILFLTTLISIAFGMMSFTDYGVAGFHLLFIILGGLSVDLHAASLVALFRL